MRLKADVSRLNLLHGTKTKNRKVRKKLNSKTVLRRNGPVKSPWSQSWKRKKSMMGF